MTYPARPPTRDEWIGVLALCVLLAVVTSQCARGTLGQGDERRIGAR
jgi:hypothetical protein